VSSVNEVDNVSRTKVPHILVVEDQPATADMLESYFKSEGYRVDAVLWGKDALDFVEETIPDLVMLDIHLPDLDGYEVCRHLRTHERTKHVPIIFLTKKRRLNAKLKGLELGAVDYITKPFDIQELRLRVRNVLRRSHAEHPQDSITDLPVSPLVDEELAKIMGRPDQAVLSVGLQGLRQFSEAYGFVARDDVIRCVAAILTHVRDDLAPGAFVGHLDATDFLIILSQDQVNALEQALLRRLNEALSFFYPYADRQAEGSDLPLSVSTKIARPAAEALDSVAEIRASLRDVD
jgi:PleD family two-component response regulator